jgi:uncharacterized protein YkwD
MKRAAASIILPFLSIFLSTLHAEGSRLDASKIEKLVFQKVNFERSREGLPDYKHHADLATVAKQHSANMVKHNFFSHVDHRDMNVRLRTLLVRPRLFARALGENLACVFGGTEEEVAQKLVTRWMDSPGHRDNILSGQFTHIGIGVQQKGDRFYATQVFGELVAKMITELPDPVPYGSEQTMRLKFLGNFPKEELSALVHFADRNARFCVKCEFYFEGFGVYKPRWEREYFTVRVKFDKGRGTYDLTLGQGNTYYSGGMKISVR